MRLYLKARDDLIVFAITGVVFSHAYRNLFNTGMLAYGDNSPFFNDSAQAFESFFYQWSPLALGSVLNSDWAQAILIAAFGNAILAQKIFFLGVLPLAFLTMYYFMGQLSDSKAARFLSALVYAIHPVTLGEFMGGTVTSNLTGYAFIPLIMLFVFRIFENRNRILNTILLAVSLALGLSFSWHSAIQIILFVFLILVVRLTAEPAEWIARLKLSLPIFVSLSAAVVLTFLLTFYWSFQLLGYVPFTRNTGEGAITTNVESFLNDVKESYPPATLPNTVRLGGILCHLGYCSGESPSQWAGFILPIVSFLALLTASNKREFGYSLAFALIVILVLGFIELTHQGATLSLFRNFPFLGIYRNPSKLLFMLAFAYSAMLGIVVKNLFAKVGSSWKSKGLIIVPFLFLWANYTWPIFTGDIGLSMTRGANSYVIPDHYIQAVGWIQSHNSDDSIYRTLWLPMDYEELEIKTRRLQPNQFAIPLGTKQFFAVPGNRLIELSQDALLSGDTRQLDDLLRLGDVKYIVVNKKSGQTAPVYREVWFLTPYLRGNPEEFLMILDMEKNFRRVEQNDNFVIYQTMH